MIERAREAYRGTALIARAYGGIYRGKAWRDGLEIASIEGASEDEVLTTLRLQVDEAFTIETTPESIEYPAEAAYRTALSAISDNLTDKYRRMLQAHFVAPERTLTAKDLGAAAGYPNWTSANLHYGKIGRMLGEYLLFQPRERAAGGPIWTLLLASGADIETTEDLWQWQMREQVADALLGVGLIQPAPQKRVRMKKAKESSAARA